MLSTSLERSSDIFSEEAIERAKFVEILLQNYQQSKIPTISVNNDARIFHDLMDLLKWDELIMMSEINFLLGCFDAAKDIIVRDIGEKVTTVVKNKWFPYIVEGSVLLYFYERPEVALLVFLSKIASKALSGYDFRQYAPPIEDPQLFRLASGETGIFSYTPFNYDLLIPLPPRHS